MMTIDSKELFEISIGPQPDNTLQARIACVKDFFKRVLAFPLKLAGKVCKTALRFVGVVFTAALLMTTLGKSSKMRELFVEKTVHLTKDLVDWILLPFAIMWWILRFLSALLFHPTFYFNAL